MTYIVDVLASPKLAGKSRVVTIGGDWVATDTFVTVELMDGLLVLENRTVFVSGV